MVIKCEMQLRQKQCTGARPYSLSFINLPWQYTQALHDQTLIAGAYLAVSEQSSRHQKALRGPCCRSFSHQVSPLCLHSNPALATGLGTCGDEPMKSGHSFQSRSRKQRALHPAPTVQFTQENSDSNNGGEQTGRLQLQND